MQEVVTPASRDHAPPPRSGGLRAMVLQSLVIGAVIAVAILLLHLVLRNLAERGVKTGFGFLSISANFGIAESAIPYTAADTYGRALIAGLVNTIIVAAIGIVLATIIGTIIGIARRSSNFIISRLAAIYVETLRNVPLLVQLIIWWDVLKVSAPGPRQAWQPLPHVFISNRGVMLPIPILGNLHVAMLAAAFVGLVVTLILARLAFRRGRDFASWRWGAALILGPPVLIALTLGGAPLALDLPELKGFNFKGGHTITPEFAAMLVGLSLYTASYIAEIVRGGIAAVGRGQTEAAAALGLRGGQIMRLVTLPQALRVIVPPLIGQYLSLTKNSSLGVAIAFPDLVSVGNTVLNQTGQAIEVIAIEMAAYLTLSLAISAVMNAYNSGIARTGAALGAQRETGETSKAKNLNAARSVPAKAILWLRANLFNSFGSTIATLLGIAILALIAPPVIHWLANATFEAKDGHACHEAGGACFAFIATWYRFLLFGRYPYAEQWRPALVVLIFIAMIAVSTRRRFWGRPLFAIWGVGLALVLFLMGGGLAGLPRVETELWNGLPLTLLLAVGSMFAAFPLAVLLALGRYSAKPVIRAPCVAYIELIRSVPLITILFMAAVMVPILLPSGFTIDKALRAAMAFALFGAAYLAEAIRGGLQAVPFGQFEASEALGLGYWRRTALVILPQALQTAIPALVNTFIGTFKDTSLVVIIGLFDLLSTAKIAIEDLNWQGFYLEAYLFIAAIFFAFCSFMSRFSQRLERRLASGSRA
jgi:general L-amino acid transport system permease protein